MKRSIQWPLTIGILLGGIYGCKIRLTFFSYRFKNILFVFENNQSSLQIRILNFQIVLRRFKLDFLRNSEILQILLLLFLTLNVLI